jgi:hypothetical protein
MADEFSVQKMDVAPTTPPQNAGPAPASSGIENSVTPAPVAPAPAPTPQPVQTRVLSTAPQAPNPYPIGAFDLSAEGTEAQTVAKVQAASTDGSTPDQAAKVLNLSMKTGIAPEFIKTDPDGFEKQMNQANFSPEQFVQSNPKLAAWVAQNPLHYPLIKNDLPNLKSMSDQLQEYGMLKDAYDALGSGVNQLFANTARIPNFAYNMAAWPQNYLASKYPDQFGNLAASAPTSNMVADFFDRQAKTFTDENSDLNDSVSSEITKGNYSRAGRVAFAKLVQSAPQLAELMVGGAQAHGLKLLLMGSQQAAESANRPENQAAGPVTGTLDAVTQGAVAMGAGEVGTFGPMAKWGETLVQNYGKATAATVMKSFTNALTYSFTRDAGSMAAMSVANDLTDYATGVNKNALEGTFGRAIESGIIGGATGALMVSPSAVLSAHSSVHDIRQAQLQKDFYTSLGDTAEASQVKKTLPLKFQEIVDALTKNGPVEHVYVDPNAMTQLYQSKGPDELPKVLSDLNIGKEFDQAKDSGGMVKIPLSDWTTKIDPQDYKAMADHVTFDPGQPTVAEATKANDIARENEHHVANNGGSFNDLGRGVIEQVSQKLQATGMDKATADKNASIYNFFNVMAQSEGTTPEELFSRYNLDITRSLPDQLKSKNIDEFDPILNKLREGKIPSEREAYGQSLIDFMKGKGGVNTAGPGSDVQAMDIKGLTRKMGMDLDRAAEQAHEAGYLKEHSIPELLQRVAAESQGQKQYAEGNRHPEKADTREQMLEMDKYLRSQGIDIQNADNESIKKALETNRDSPKQAKDFFDFLQSNGLEKKSGPVFRGKLLGVAHLSHGITDHFINPEHVSNEIRYDGGEGVFGKHTYFDESGNWVAGDGGYRGQIAGDKVHSADLNFKKALLITPETIKSLPREILKMNGDEAVEWLKKNGYDGLIIRGMDDFGQPISDAAHAATLEKHGIGWMNSRPGETEEQARQRRIDTHAETAKFISDRTGGLENLSQWQDQVVSFYPHENAENVKYIGSKDAVSTKDIAAQEKRDRYQYYQNGDHDPMGGITFHPDKTTISLLKDANLSTFLHETGHFFTKVLNDLASRPDASERTKEINRALYDFAGAEHGSELTREQHEKIAEGFEKYLMEGKAPSSALREAFAAFKAWMIHAYKTLMAHPDVTLTPEVRNAFDRMIATDDEIADARNSVGLNPLFSDPHKFMTPEDAAKYAKTVQEARAAAEDNLTAKNMKAVERERSKQYKIERESVEREITAEVEARPEYRALDAIKSGELPNGQKVDLQLDRKTIVADYGKDIAKEMPRGTLTKDGLHYEQAAELLGFNSGHELVMALANAQPKDDLIRQETDNEMRQRYAYEDPTVNGQMQEEAMKSIHNAKESSRLAFELKWIMENKLGDYKELMRRIGKRVITAESFQKQADTITATLSTRDLKPYLYQRAETKAANEAMNQALKGAWDKAFEAKYQEFLNHELYKAVSESQADVQKSVDGFKDFNKKDDVLSKTRDMNLINAGRVILDQLGIGSVERGEKAQDYLEKLKKYGDVDQYNESVAQVQSLGQLKAYGDMPYGQFQAVREQLDALWDLAKMNRELDLQNERVDLNQAQEETRNQLADVKPGNFRKYRGEGGKTTKLEDLTTGALSIGSMLVRVEHFVDALSNGDINSPLYKYLWLPIKEASSKFRLANDAAQDRISDMNEKIFKKLSYERIEAPELGQTAEGENIFFPDQAHLMMAIAHSGNESNLKKLLIGRGWGSMDEEGNLDRSQWDEFLKRAMTDGSVTKDMMDWVQGMWDLNESLLPDAQKAHYKRYGRYFDTVEHTPVQTPFGDYKGGYIPAAADRDLTKTGYTDQVIRQGKAILESDSGYSLLPGSSNGFTKKRVDNYNVPLSLDPGLIGSHVREVLKFTHMDPTIYQVGRLILDRGVSKGFDSILPEATKKVLIPFLDRAKQQTTGKPGSNRYLDQAMNYLRTNNSAMVFFLNARNTLMMFHGIPMAMSKEIPASYTARGFLSYMQDAKGTQEMISEKSPWMSSRFNDRSTTMRKTLYDIANGTGTASDIKKYIVANSFFTQHAVQNVVDVGMWKASYDHAISQGHAEDQAIAKADAVISQTQHNMEPISISSAEHTTPLVKSLLGFYSFQNLKLNLQAGEYYKALKFQGIKQAAFRALPIFAYTSAIPAMMMTTAAIALSGKAWDESGDGAWQAFASKVGQNIGRDTLAEIPIVGSMVDSMLHEKRKGEADRLNSPALDALYAGIHAPGEIKNAIHSGKWDDKSIKDSLTLMSLISGVPVTPLAKPVSYLNQVNSGNAHPTGPIDFTRGLITGQKGR